VSPTTEDGQLWPSGTVVVAAAEPAVARSGASGASAVSARDFRLLRGVAGVLGVRCIGGVVRAFRGFGLGLLGFRCVAAGVLVDPWLLLGRGRSRAGRRSVDAGATERDAERRRTGGDDHGEELLVFMADLDAWPMRRGWMPRADSALNALNALSGEDTE
jgi:hypothetical protein